MKVLVPVQQITLAKQKEMLRLGGRNTRTQIKILNQLTKSDFPDHKFDWKILLTVHANTKLCKILESSIIALKRPSLNEQLNFDQLILFRNGVTLI